MQRDTRVEITRLVVMLVVAIAITGIWLAAVIRPDQITETRAELGQAVLGVVLIVTEIAIFAYAVRRLRHASQPHQTTQRRIEVIDNSVSMKGGDESTQIYAQGQVRTNTVWGTQVQVGDSTVVSVLAFSIVGLALLSLTFVIVLLLQRLDVIAASSQPSVAVVEIPPEKATVGLTLTEQPPYSVGLPVSTETVDLRPTSSAATPTTTVGLHSTQDVPFATQTALDNRSTTTAEVVIESSETSTPQPSATTALPTVDLQATVQALMSRYVTQTALAVATTPPQPPTVQPTPANTQPPVRATNTPPPARPTNTPTPPARTYTAPQLIAPASGSAFESGQTVTLQWNSVGTLAPGDHYLLAVQHSGGSEWRVTNDFSWSVPAWMACSQLPDGCTWWVAVVRGAEVDGYPQAPGQVVSANSAVWRFGWLQPSGGEPQPPAGGAPPSPTPPLVITPDS